jgi:maleylpyruvate isomerase
VAQNGSTGELNRDIELAVGEHGRLLSALDALVEAEALDVAAPSALPGWTVGHVLAHITNSGGGHADIFDTAADGRVGIQYPGGMDGRAADIEADSVAAAADQVEALRRSIDRLQACWAESDWQGSGIVPLGEVPLADLAFFRIREVAVHHADLNIGYTFADLPPAYLRLELRRMGMLFKARQPMGMAAIPTEAMAAPPPARLAWLMGRGDIEGLSAAGIF